MANDIKNKYGASTQTITLTIASLTNASMRQSAAIDNTTDLYMGGNVNFSLKAGTSPSATGRVDIWAAGSVDGTNYAGGCTGSDAAFTGDTDNLIYVGSVALKTTTGVVGNAQFSLARIFGGVGNIPIKYAFVIQNNTGVTMDATAGNHSVILQGNLAQVV